MIIFRSLVRYAKYWEVKENGRLGFKDVFLSSSQLVHALDTCTVVEDQFPQLCFYVYLYIRKMNDSLYIIPVLQVPVRVRVITAADKYAFDIYNIAAAPKSCIELKK
jgi:hypothetical protein